MDIVDNLIMDEFLRTVYQNAEILIADICAKLSQSSLRESVLWQIREEPYKKVPSLLRKDASDRIMILNSLKWWYQGLSPERKATITEIHWQLEELIRTLAELTEEFRYKSITTYSSDEDGLFDDDYYRFQGQKGQLEVAVREIGLQLVQGARDIPLMIPGYRRWIRDPTRPSGLARNPSPEAIFIHGENPFIDYGEWLGRLLKRPHIRATQNCMEQWAEHFRNLNVPLNRKIIALAKFVPLFRAWQAMVRLLGRPGMTNILFISLYESLLEVIEEARKQKEDLEDALAELILDALWSFEPSYDPKSADLKPLHPIGYIHRVLKDPLNRRLAYHYLLWCIQGSEANYHLQMQLEALKDDSSYYDDINNARKIERKDYPKGHVFQGPSEPIRALARFALAREQGDLDYARQIAEMFPCKALVKALQQTLRS